MQLVIYGIIVLGVLGALFGAILAFASKIFYVEVDPKQEQVRECLAGANCGGCGFPGCDGYAAAVAKGEAPVNKCVAAGPEAAAKIAEIMGVAAGDVEKKVAFVPCSGTEGHASKRFNYSGPQNCQAAMLFGGKSNMDCRFACIGLGNCANACQFGAMSIVDGVAKVDREKCVGCGACVDACPKKIVKLVPYDQHVLVACSSCDKGAAVRRGLHRLHEVPARVPCRRDRHSGQPGSHRCFQMRSVRTLLRYLPAPHHQGAELIKTKA